MSVKNCKEMEKEAKNFEKESLTEAVEKYKESQNEEMQRGYDFAIDKIINEEISGTQIYKYSNTDHRYFWQIRRDIGIKENDLFFRGFVKACKDIVKKSDEET